MTETPGSKQIAAVLLKWYDANKRTFAFRDIKDAYKTWVSEIMLQQTRTETAEGYFVRFTARFPDVKALAEAPEEDVLKMWEGLGYYTRARNLHKAAKVIREKHSGVFPCRYEEIRALPGVGDYTAAAISSITFDLPYPAMDGNLTRVFSRLYDRHEDMDKPAAKQLLAAIAQNEMPETRCGDFNQALMDIGATICLPGTPECDLCPLKGFCDGMKHGRAEELPVHAKAKPPKDVQMTVLLLRAGSRIAMTQRKQALLNGLWTFLLFEDMTEEQMLQSPLLKGKPIRNIREAGNARHVFTHLIWNMKLITAEMDEETTLNGVTWVEISEIDRLTLPGAMKKAKETAKRML